MVQIIGSLQTNRLIIEDAHPTEAPLLQAVCESWTQKLVIEGYGFDSDYIVRCFTEGDLPPVATASKENYRLKVIKDRHFLTAEGHPRVVGLFDLYHGYPYADCLYISLMVLKNQDRSKGYGQECVEALICEAVERQYGRLMVGVHLKNWPGLRFWTRVGFDKVVGLYGDAEYGIDHYAIMGLEKVL